MEHDDETQFDEDEAETLLGGEGAELASTVKFGPTGSGISPSHTSRAPSHAGFPAPIPPPPPDDHAATVRFGAGGAPGAPASGAGGPALPRGPAVPGGPAVPAPCCGGSKIATKA